MTPHSCPRVKSGGIGQYISNCTFSHTHVAECFNQQPLNLSQQTQRSCNRSGSPLRTNALRVFKNQNARREAAGSQPKKSSCRPLKTSNPSARKKLKSHIVESAGRAGDAIRHPHGKQNARMTGLAWRDLFPGKPAGLREFPTTGC